MKNYKRIIFVTFFIIVLIVALIVLCRFRKKENFEEYTTVNAYKNNKQFHEPYTYNYDNAFKDVSIFQKSDFLAFMCFKLPSKLFEDIDNNPIKTIQNELSCKTIVLENINKMYPQHNLIDIVKTHIKELGNNILGPVYVILCQYPNKFYKGSNIYSQFNIASKNALPYIHHENGIMKYEGPVDIKALLVLPMYSKNEMLTTFSEGSLMSKDGYYLDGITDMLSYFNKYASKDNLCFIKCNKSTDLYCGCASRNEGEYLSYCKDIKTEDKFASYGWIYRVNETNIKDDGVFIKKIEISNQLEKKITQASSINSYVSSGGGV